MCVERSMRANSHWNVVTHVSISTLLESSTTSLCDWYISCKKSFDSRRAWMAQIVRVHCVPHTRSKFKSLQCPMLVQVRGSNRLGCKADRQEVSRCRTRGDSEEGWAPLSQCVNTHKECLFSFKWPIHIHVCGFFWVSWSIVNTVNLLLPT